MNTDLELFIDIAAIIILFYLLVQRSEVPTLFFLMATWVAIGSWGIYDNYWPLAIISLMVIAVMAPTIRYSVQGVRQIAYRPYVMINFIVTLVIAHALIWGYSLDFRGMDKNSAPSCIKPIFKYSENDPIGNYYQHSLTERIRASVINVCVDGYFANHYLLGFTMAPEDHSFIYYDKTSNHMKRITGGINDVLDITHYKNSPMYLLLFGHVPNTNLAILEEKDTGVEIVWRRQLSALVGEHAFSELTKDDRVHWVRFVEDPLSNKLFLTLDGAETTFELNIGNHDISLGKSYHGARFVSYGGIKLSIDNEGTICRSINDLLVAKKENIVPMASKFTEVKYNSETDRLYITNFRRGYLYIVDAKNLIIEKIIRLDRGIRYLEFNPKYRKLFVTNYIYGKLHIINTDTQQVENTLLLGSRMRSLRNTRDLDGLIITSASGAFYIDIADLLKQKK